MSIYMYSQRKKNFFISCFIVHSLRQKNVLTEKLKKDQYGFVIHGKVSFLVKD